MSEIGYIDTTKYNPYPVAAQGPLQRIMRANCTILPYGSEIWIDADHYRVIWTDGLGQHLLERIG